jgi:benzylsuccinate CoA-transferase BbsF subunit
MTGTQPQRQGNRDPRMAPHNCFRCAGDDQWVTIACETDDEWQALCRAIGQPHLATDARFLTSCDRKAREDEIDDILTAWTAPRDKWEVTRTLQAAGVAAFPSMTTKDIAEDPQLEGRGFFVRLSHPEVGVRTNTGIPWVLAHSAAHVRSPAPLLGQHTDQVMRDILGYSEQRIAELKERKILD